ncbi:hypothetical protein COO60DRAFT_132497 [Scenedesmus sp. NREL 46B-D3]|nr:hypothetical protein COO60DRAFT_132497 [Scenedesmus sp. NREL 46B-D3]
MTSSRGWLRIMNAMLLGLHAALQNQHGSSRLVSAGASILCCTAGAELSIAVQQLLPNTAVRLPLNCNTHVLLVHPGTPDVPLQLILCSLTAHGVRAAAALAAVAVLCRVCRCNACQVPAGRLYRAWGEAARTQHARVAAEVWCGRRVRAARALPCCRDGGLPHLHAHGRDAGGACCAVHQGWLHQGAVQPGVPPARRHCWCDTGGAGVHHGGAQRVLDQGGCTAAAAWWQPGAGVRPGRLQVQHGQQRADHAVQDPGEVCTVLPGTCALGVCHQCARLVCHSLEAAVVFPGRKDQVTCNGGVRGQGDPASAGAPLGRHAQRAGGVGRRQPHTISGVPRTPTYGSFCQGAKRGQQQQGSRAAAHPAAASAAELRP